MSNITFTLNHNVVTIDIDPTKRLLDVLRNDFHLTGSKEGCGEGECGACAILLNGKAINSCLLPVGSVQGQDVVTIEGLSQSRQGQALSDAYRDEGAVQCGICTPGMLIASHALLLENPHPTDDEIRIGLSGNLCRCTGYNMIVKAVKKASEDGEGLW